MSKPDDIPQWAWDEADRVLGDMPEVAFEAHDIRPAWEFVARALLAAYERGRGEQREAVKTLEQIVLIDRREKRTCVDVDPAGNTYAVEMVDGPCAKVARLTLNSLKAST